MESLLALVKQSLAIVPTATGRDTELTALIRAAVDDLTRQGIAVDTIYFNNNLVNSAIVMFVKANFGMIDEKQKDYAQKTYILLCQNLGASSEYKEIEDV